MKRAIAFFLTATCACLAADVMELKNGQRREGCIIAIDERFIRLEIDPPKQVTQTSQPRSSIAIPKSDVRAINFSPSPELDKAILAARIEDLSVLEPAWEKFRPWLEMPRSPAGSIACSLGNALLATNNRQNAKRALELFTLVEEKSWKDTDQARAREGRLRAMSATGKAAQAIEEAKILAAETENPEILIEANYLMAQAAAKDLEAFLKENPRWNIDPAVINERHRLLNRALELYLHPALFFGSESAKAARGLWGAVQVYQLAAKNADDADIPDLEKSSTDLAIETCRDITALYPATPEAKAAAEYLASIPRERLAVNFEVEGRADLENANRAPAAATPASTPPAKTSPTPKSERVKKSKKHEKK